MLYAWDIVVQEGPVTDARAPSHCSLLNPPETEPCNRHDVVSRRGIPCCGTEQNGGRRQLPRGMRHQARQGLTMQCEDITRPSSCLSALSDLFVNVQDDESQTPPMKRVAVGSAAPAMATMPLPRPIPAGSSGKENGFVDIHSVQSGRSSSSSPQEKVGIGAYFKRLPDTGDLEVKSFLRNSPAELSGQIQIGDRITHVDGVLVVGWSLSELADKILGPTGSEAEVSFLRRTTGEPYTVKVIRGRNTLLCPRG